MTATSPPSDRTTVKRGADRADYRSETVLEILRAGTIAHVGVSTDDGPIVLPMAYGVIDDDLVIHGSVANAMMRAGTGLDICVTVTIVDGLVVARTPFHNSMNYRSVVVRGTASPIKDEQQKLAALKAMNDHIVPLWDTSRPPSDVDLRQTLVLTLPLTEASAKVRGGDPVDEADDLTGPHWAGVVPLISTWGAPTASEDLNDGIDPPPTVISMAGLDPHRKR